MTNLKKSKRLERHFKGAANHYRIDIILLISKNPGLTVEGIAQEIGGNLKTISQHVRKLDQAGLVDKKYKGRFVVHKLSPYGKKFAKLIKSFS